MKATTWFCPVLLTLLCAARLVCTAQRGGYAGLGLGLDYMDANVLQDDYLLEKRNKPSLSIVNPLDVLRQRLLLEIARRQMKDTTRQVELNRAILKNVGKRMLATRQHFPSELFNLALPPPSTFSDFLQGQQQQQRRAQYDLPEPQFTQTQPVFISDILDDAAKKSQSDQPDSLTKHQANGNEISNETNKQKLRAAAKAADVLAVGRRIATGSFGPNDFNWSTNDDDNVDDGSVNGNGNGEAFHFPYLQQLRKKHFAN